MGQVPPWLYFLGCKVGMSTIRSQRHLELCSAQRSYLALPTSVTVLLKISFEELYGALPGASPTQRELSPSGQRSNAV